MNAERAGLPLSLPGLRAGSVRCVREIAYICIEHAMQMRTDLPLVVHAIADERARRGGTLCEHRRMLPERRIPTRSPEWRTMFERIQVAMDLTSRLNVLLPSDIDARHALLRELLGDPHPEKSFIFPPFYCTSGVGTQLGERASVGQACSFLDLGGITIGERTMISPKVTLVTEGHPIEPVERYDFITVAPIVIEANVWVGAAATILPGVTIGHDSIVGAGAVIAKDVPPLTVVTGPGHTVRRHLRPAPELNS